ncbi:unnamed protein product, partial [Clonostachys byssicola]
MLEKRALGFSTWSTPPTANLTGSQSRRTFEYKKRVEETQRWFEIINIVTSANEEIRVRYLPDLSLCSNRFPVMGFEFLEFG